MITVLVMLLLISSQCLLLFQSTRRMLALAGLNSQSNKIGKLTNDLLVEGIYKYETNKKEELEKTIYRSSPNQIIALEQSGYAYLIAKKEGQLAGFKIIGKLSE